MFVLTRRRLAPFAALTAILALPRAAAAQVREFDACSQGVLSNCADIRLTSQLGAGSGGSNLFQIAIDNLGSRANSTLPTSIYLLTLLTGQPGAAGVDNSVTPVAEGGSTLSDTSPWDVFDSGDAIFLSAPAGDGIGGCATASPVGGFGQMSATCGADHFITFTFSTPEVFDPSTMTISELEIVGIASTPDGNPADSCDDSTPCVTTPVTTTPEPASIALTLTGLSGLAAVRLRRKIGLRAHRMITGEA